MWGYVSQFDVCSAENQYKKLPVIRLRVLTSSCLEIKELYYTVRQKNANETIVKFIRILKPHRRKIGHMSTSTVKKMSLSSLQPLGIEMDNTTTFCNYNYPAGFVRSERVRVD